MTISNRSYGVAGWVAAGFGSGWLPKAPGTWGSLASLPPAWLLLYFFGPFTLLIAGLLVWLLGCLVCVRVLPLMPDKDPGWIVIDEWAGQWLCLALLAMWMGSSMLVIMLAFMAFRLLDIFKPWPISLAERLGPPWWSIMADDVLAGVIGAGLIIAAGVMAGWIVW